MLYDRVAFPDNVPLKFRVIDIQEYPFHMHNDVLEIMFALEGAFELTVVNNVLHMSAGDIYISSPNELHRLCAYDHTHGLIMLIHIDLAAYKAEFPDLGTYQFANSALENNNTGMQILGNYLKKQIPRLLDEQESPQTNVTQVGEKILKILIQEFQCYYLGKYYPEFNDVYKGNEIQLSRIRRILDYIYANYNQPIKIKDVADMEHISTYHLTYVLKNGCGMGFRMFLNMARVEKSAAMLLDSGKGLQVIACECGFSKYQYFSETFEKVFRMTPAQYRQKYRHNTIAVQPCRLRVVGGEELKTFLRRFCSTSGEIRLDLSRREAHTPFKTPRCINLWGGRYDHITGLPLLKHLRGEISFQTLGIDMDFLRRYRNSPRTLEYILSDLWTLQVGIRVCVSWREPTRSLRLYLELLKRALCGAEGRLEFLLLVERQEELDGTGEMEGLIANCGFAGVPMGKSLCMGGNPIHGSGYMPCFLLHALAGREGFYAGHLALTDERGEVNARGGLSLLTDRGLKKPVYHLLYLLDRMGTVLLDQGEMYFVTQTPGSEDFQVLVYYYDECFDALFQHAEKAAEHATFIDLLAKDYDYNRALTLRLEQMTGRYALRKYRLTAEDYLSKYKEAPFLAYETLSQESVQVLSQTLAPEVSLSMLEPNGSLQLDVKLDPFEIILFCFEKL